MQPRGQKQIANEGKHATGLARERRHVLVGESSQRRETAVAEVYRQSSTRDCEVPVECQLNVKLNVEQLNAKQEPKKDAS